MLIIDGVKYKLWIPADEEKEFHPMIKEHSKEIFGEDSLYFDVKHTLRSKSGIGSIPDAYAISLSKPSNWYIVENELSTHSVYSHVVPQISKFISGIDNLRSQREIRDVLYREITRDAVLKASVEKMIHPKEIHHFLSSLISEPPKIVIIIDEVTEEVREASKALKRLGQTEVVEFKTFVREDAENIRAHLFKPIRTAVTPSQAEEEVAGRAKTGEIMPRDEYRLPILEALIEMGGKGRVTNVLERVFDKIEDQLKPKDFEKLPSGTAIRWKNRARWERQRLKREGYLKRDSPQGIWEITDEGRKLYEKLKQR